MQNVNKKIIVENVVRLMKENDLNQTKLKDILNMSQPNLSKALNVRDKKLFTVNQLVNIAIYFNISLDDLVGHKITNKTNKRDTAAQIIEFLCHQDAELIKVKKHEVIYDWQPNNYPYECACEREADNEYTAIFFPNYRSLPEPSELTEDEKEDIMMDLRANGNANNNFGINKFLNDISKIIVLYLKHQIPEEAFQSIVNSYLDNIDKTDAKIVP